MMMWKSSAQLDIEWENLDHIMHEDSPKITRNWQEYQLKGLVHAYLRGGGIVTLHVPIWKSWREEHLVPNVRKYMST